MPEMSRTHLRQISSLELALIRYTQVTCHIGTKQTQSTPEKDTRKRSVAQTTTYKKIGQMNRKEDTVLPQRKVNTRLKLETKIPKFNSTRKATIPNFDCLTQVETLNGTWVRHMASSRQLTTRQQIGGISPYPHAVVRAAADRCRCYTAVCCPSKKKLGGAAKWKRYPPLIIVHLRGTMFSEKNVSL